MTLTVRLKSGLFFWLTESGINIGQTGMTNQWILMFHLQFQLLGRKFKALLFTFFIAIYSCYPSTMLHTKRQQKEGSRGLSE